MRNATIEPRAQRRFRDPSTKLAITWVDPAWHTSAIYEATAVRRILRGANAGGNGVVGLDATMDAPEMKLTGIGAILSRPPRRRMAKHNAGSGANGEDNVC
jgi:hypothetical protein